MKRRDFLHAAGAGAAMTGSGGAAGQGRPNIVLILSDDHSAPHVGCYGNPDIRTPNLDRFAAAGVRFDRAYVTCPQCMPSRASMMTGRSPVAIRMTRFNAPLPMSVRTYPEVLRAAGYFTGVAGRMYHLDGPANPAFEEYYDRLGLRTFPKRLDFVKTARTREERLAQFREFLEKRPRDKPFFLQWCSSDPHRKLDRNAVSPPHEPAGLKLPAHYPDTPLEPVLTKSRWCLLKRPENLTANQKVKLKDLVRYKLAERSRLSAQGECLAILELRVHRLGGQVPRPVVPPSDALADRTDEESRPNPTRPRGAHPQLFPRTERVFQRRHRRPQQQGEGHYEKILRVPNIPSHRTRAISLTWQVARAGAYPQILLMNPEKTKRKRQRLRTS